MDHKYYVFIGIAALVAVAVWYFKTHSNKDVKTVKIKGLNTQSSDYPTQWKLQPGITGVTGNQFKADYLDVDENSEAAPAGLSPQWTVNPPDLATVTTTTDPLSVKLNPLRGGSGSLVFNDGKYSDSMVFSVISA